MVSVSSLSYLWNRDENSAPPPEDCAVAAICLTHDHHNKTEDSFSPYSWARGQTQKGNVGWNSTGRPLNYQCSFVLSPTGQLQVNQPCNTAEKLKVEQETLNLCCWTLLPDKEESSDVCFLCLLRKGPKARVAENSFYFRYLLTKPKLY